jgi:hypothetical protein
MLPKAILALAAVATLGAAGLAPTSASAFGRTHSSMRMMSVERPIIHPNDRFGFCGDPRCRNLRAERSIFVWPRNPGNAAFAR